jgi:hypothetical protein
MEYVISLVFVEQKMIGVRRGMVLSSIDALSLSLLIYYAVRPDIFNQAERRGFHPSGRAEVSGSGQLQPASEMI